MNLTPEGVERVKVLRPLATLSDTTVLPVLIATTAGRRLWEIHHQLLGTSLTCWRLMDGPHREVPPLADEIRKQVFENRDD